MCSVPIGRVVALFGSVIFLRNFPLGKNVRGSFKNIAKQSEGLFYVWPLVSRTDDFPTRSSVIVITTIFSDFPFSYM